MGVNYEFVRGGSSGIDNKPLKDGQVLFDTERKRIFIDKNDNGTLTRVSMGFYTADNIDSAMSSTSANPVENRVLSGVLDKTYKDDDTAETDIADSDYVPFYDTSASAKRKSLWSNVVAKIKAALGIESGGSTYLKKDGTWGTPTDSTKVAKAGDTMSGDLTIEKVAAANTEGKSILSLGNATAKASANNSRGYMRIYSDSTGYTQLITATGAAGATQTLQNKGGTIALTSQLTDGSVTKAGSASFNSDDNVSVVGNIYIRGGNNTTEAYLAIGTNDSPSVQDYVAHSGVLRIYAKDYTHRVDIRENATTITVNPTLSLPNGSGTIQVSSPSSRRVKKNIRDMSDDEAKKLLDVNIVKYDYKGDWCGGEKNQSGVIAEDTIDIIPEAVYIPRDYDPREPVDEEYNTPPYVDYRKFIPYLIKMVQIQQTEIDALKEDKV